LKVTLYTKAECGLCEEAEAMLRRLQRKIRFQLDYVDVEADAAAHEKYGERIPVITIDDQVVAAAPLDEAGLEALLRR
jgi:glutaredoxin